MKPNKNKIYQDVKKSKICKIGNLGVTLRVNLLLFTKDLIQ